VLGPAVAFGVVSLIVAAVVETAAGAAFASAEVVAVVAEVVFWVMSSGLVYVAYLQLAEG
jgi:hypothetical protein